MTNPSFALIILIIWLLLTPLTIQAQSQGHTLRGRVHSASGAGVPWIIADLEDSDSKSVAMAITDNAGNFGFTGLTGTSYAVVIRAYGYEPASKNIKFTGKAGPDGQGETRILDISLTPKSNARPAKPPPAFTQNVPPAARSVYDRAMKLGLAGKRQLAFTMMQEAVRIFPDYFEAHFVLGNELMKAEHFSEAYAELNKALKINPNDGRVYQSLGLILMRQKKYAVAAAVFAESWRADSSDPQTALLRAVALIEHASTINPSQSESANTERNDALNEAEKWLTYASAQGGNKLAVVHFQKARIYLRKGEAVRAADELEQYLQMAPNDKEADSLRSAIEKLRSATSGVTPSPQ